MAEEKNQGGVSSSALFIARTKLGGGKSWPPCPAKYSGAAIVAGNAWCLHEDLEAAKNKIGDVPVIAVNGASKEVKAIALFSYHPHRFVEKGCEWIRHQNRLFGSGFTVHASKQEPGMPYVDFWWQDARGRGSSAWGARKLAWLLGFDTVVIAGCPLLPGNYANGGLGKNMTVSDIVNQYANEIASDTDWHDGCYSMSGTTRDILGGI